MIRAPMPIGTPFHPRTSALCESMSWREWAGYFAVSAYEANHEREYNAIRNAAALIDVSPLFKYRVSGTRRDAPRRPHRHARRAEDGRGPGVLHELVRRRRQGDRRRHRLAARARALPLDRRRAQPALDPAERPRPRGRGRGRLGPARGARAPGADEPRDPEELRRGRRGGAQVLPRDAGDASAASRSRSRAPATPATWATRSGSRPSRRSPLWDALDGGGARRTTSRPPACWRSTSRASRRG